MILVRWIVFRILALLAGMDTANPLNQMDLSDFVDWLHNIVK